MKAFVLEISVRRHHREVAPYQARLTALPPVWFTLPRVPLWIRSWATQFFSPPVKRTPQMPALPRLAP